jgi:hypothetical protein
MLKRKKAQILEYIVSYIVKFILAGLVFTMFYFMIKFAINENLDVNHLETSLIYNRLLYSNPGIFYYNPYTEMVEPGIVDINEWKSKNFEAKIEKSLNISDYIGIKLILSNSSNKLFEKYIYRETYESLAPLSIARGPGNSIREIHNLYVLIQDKNKPLKELYSKGNIKIEVLKYHTR